MKRYMSLWRGGARERARDREEREREEREERGESGEERRERGGEKEERKRRERGERRDRENREREKSARDEREESYKTGVEYQMLSWCGSSTCVATKGIGMRTDSAQHHDIIQLVVVTEGRIFIEINNFRGFEERDGHTKRSNPIGGVRYPVTA